MFYWSSEVEISPYYNVWMVLCMNEWLINQWKSLNGNIDVIPHYRRNISQEHLLCHTYFLTSQFRVAMPCNTSVPGREYRVYHSVLRLVFYSSWVDESPVRWGSLTVGFLYYTPGGTTPLQVNWKSRRVNDRWGISAGWVLIICSLIMYFWCCIMIDEL